MLVKQEKICERATGVLTSAKVPSVASQQLRNLTSLGGESHIREKKGGFLNAAGEMRKRKLVYMHRSWKNYTMSCKQGC